MICVSISKSQICQEEKCGKRCSYGYINQKAQYCVNHKKNEMINVNYKHKYKDKKCIEDGCKKTPSFNYLGSKGLLYCKTHAKENMINISSSKCITSGCIKHRLYGLPEGKPEYCRIHRIKGMIEIYKKKCEEKECLVIPSFGFKGDKVRFCVNHAIENMVCLSGKYCLNEDCKKRATFGIEHKKPFFCFDHKENDMEDVVNKKCNFDECNHVTTWGYGYPGKLVERCAKHKEEGMILRPRKKCMECEEFAIYGLNKPMHCEEHQKVEEYNLLERKCISCGLLNVLGKEEKCGFCDPIVLKRYRLVKQREIKFLFDSQKIKYENYDEQLPGKCNKKRHDFVFDADTHKIVVEVDEHQHDNYNCECEQVRMAQITQAIGMPTIFIRYNPDNYNVNNVIIKTSKIERQKILIKTLYELKLLSPKNTQEFLRVCYLYFNQFNGTLQLTNIPIT